MLHRVIHGSNENLQELKNYGVNASNLLDKEEKVDEALMGQPYSTNKMEYEIQNGHEGGIAINSVKYQDVVMIH
ncbi:11072_t:CDS:2 [Gigaspora margarita]|uniref:11072_t:CDS:1 n=1 Tax=Gigaspora margarita TaxID=4874 RepID=A0ABN7VG52_GIGMA|nr:11072_t:CDS:2 [Gigaspora margarita]